MGLADYRDECANATSTQGGQWFSPGFVGVVRVKQMRDYKGEKGRKLITTVEVLESNSDKDPVGCTRDYFIKFPEEKFKRGRMWEDAKSMMFALCMDTTRKAVGTKDENPKAHAEAAEYVSLAFDAEYAAKKDAPPNPFAGLTARLETYAKAYAGTPANPNGGVFTVHEWSPVPKAG